jgi:hypothetical protein
LSESPKAKLALLRVENQVPEDLHQAMLAFVAQHPQWPQPRLLQVAVACFLFQYGSKNPAVVEHYLAGMFQKTGPGAWGSTGIKPLILAS